MKAVRQSKAQSRDQVPIPLIAVQIIGHLDPDGVPVYTGHELLVHPTLQEKFPEDYLALQIREVLLHALTTEWAAPSIEATP